MRLQRYITESINDKGILKACFMVGNPGAGKSYVISKISSGSIEPRVINTDKIKEFLGYLKVDDWKDEYILDKIDTLTKNQLALYINSLLPLWVDSTSSNPSNLIRRKGILSSLGYDVCMIWVETSLETSLERAAKREREASEDFIRIVYKKIQKLKPYYRREFRHFKTINNDDGELTNKVILDSYKSMEKYFLSPVVNPIGVDLLNNMRKNDHKYLSDTDRYTMSYINKLVGTWYTK